MADIPVHVPPEWAEAAEHIRLHAVHRVLVMGARDTGKSTLCRCLLDAAAQSGCSIALLDADVGQKIIGPPACVTMSDPAGMALAFVGTTNPVLGWTRLIEGTRRLARDTHADLLVVNTSGLLAGPGRRLKAAKIDAIEPDLLIALGNDPDLDAVLDDPARTVLRLPSSPEARRKTEGEKRALRREAFRRYFTGSSVQLLAREAWQTTQASEPLAARLLVGLADAAGNELGLGLLIGSQDSSLGILSPVAPGGISRIIPGLLCLDENFAETPVSRALQAPLSSSQGTSGGGVG